MRLPLKKSLSSHCAEKQEQILPHAVSLGCVSHAFGMISVANLPSGWKETRLTVPTLGGWGKWILGWRVELLHRVKFR